MREILFRGKRVDNGEWLNGYYKPCGIHIGTIEEEIYPTISEFGNYLSFEVVPLTVGQFTGLFDKKGKRIFEGDIIKNEYAEGKYQFFKIIYNETAHLWEVENKYRCRMKLCHVMSSMEVIGNIHDNPELLEGGDLK